MKKLLLLPGCLAAAWLLPGCEFADLFSFFFLSFPFFFVWPRNVKSLQLDINDILVLCQNLTADPRANPKLGKVGVEIKKGSKK